MITDVMSDLPRFVLPIASGPSLAWAFDWANALPAAAIALREGFEAVLVVGLVLACLAQADRPDLRRWVWSGVGVGLVASVAVAAAIGQLFQALDRSNQPTAPVIQQGLEAGLGLLAIGLLSWMLVWMTQQAQNLKGEVQASVQRALQATEPTPASPIAQPTQLGGLGEPDRVVPPSDSARLDRQPRDHRSDRAAWAIGSLVAIAVLQEGFETVLFVVAQLHQGWGAAFGAVVGAIGAAGLGLLLFRWGIKINVRRFFSIMGTVLLAVVGALVISVLRHLDRALQLLSQIDDRWRSLCWFASDLPGALPGSGSCVLGPQVWDWSNGLSDRQFPGVLLKSLLGYRDHLYTTQAIAYLLFMVTIGGFYFLSLRGQFSPHSTSKASLGSKP